MKKMIPFVYFLAAVLCACGSAPSQPQAPAEDPAAVQPVLEATPVPTSVAPTPLTLPTVFPSPTLAPAQAPATQAQAAPVQASPAPTKPPAPSGSILIDDSLSGGVFENMSVSGDRFSLRCNPKEISFDVSSTDIYITQVEVYYRIRDKHSNYVPAWSRAATMETDGLYHFWMTYSGESVKADNRKAHGWFDFEFVGINKYGDVIGRSEKIVGLVSYTTDCP